MLRLLLMMLFTCALGCLAAQQEYVWNRISTDDGFSLASNTVTSLYQDQKGFVWVGSNNGLQRFDGSKFIYYGGRKEGNDDLPVSTLSQIIPVENGKLLLSFGLMRELGIFDPASFEFKKIAVHAANNPNPGASYSVWKDNAGEIYLTIAGYGVLHFERSKNRFVPDNHFHLPPGFIPGYLGVYTDTLKKQLWFSCDKGLCIYDERSKQTWWSGNNPLHVPQLDNKDMQDFPHHVYIDSQRRCWILSWPGQRTQRVFCTDSAGKILPDAVTGLNTGERYEDYVNVFETKEKNIWVYGEGCVYHYSDHANAFVYNRSMSSAYAKTSLFYERIYQMMEDRDGSIWLATDKGLYIAARQSGSFSIINWLGHSSINITGIFEDDPAHFWITNWGRGLMRTDSIFTELPTDIYKTKLPAGWGKPLQDAVKLTWSMCELPGTNSLLVACQEGVLFEYDKQTHQTKYMRPPELQGWTARCIAKDSSARVWIGSQGGHLLRYENGKCTLVQRVNGIICSLFVDNEGLLWFNTNELGVYAVDPASGKILQHYKADNHANAMFTNTGKDVQQLNDSIIAVADGPLYFINKKSGKVTVFDHNSGLPANNVYRIGKDKEGYLWIITSEGLCRYNPANNRITTYGKRDGITLASTATETRLVSSSGKMIFGGNNAIIAFTPEAFNRKESPPDVSITDFKVFNEYIPVDSLLQYPETKLAPNQNSFSIYFSALSYLQRDQLTYYYKMEGIDKDWKSDARYQNYSWLPPGDYVFKVYCENKEGLRSPNITSMNITVTPPFWKSIWFIGLMILLAGALVLAIHNVRVKHLLAVERLRHSVARDLHDDVGSTLSTINILSSMAKTKMSTDTVQATEYLGKINDNSQRMMETMDDIVWSIKPSNDSIQKITYRMREFGTGMLEPKDIHFTFSVDEAIETLKLDMAARRDFFLIYKEAINNAAKYSHAGNVEASVCARKHLLVLTVSDNGVGFNASDSESGNGINNMKKRAENMRAHFSITTAPGQGCKIELLVPIKK